MLSLLYKSTILKNQINYHKLIDLSILTHFSYLNATIEILFTEAMHQNKLCKWVESFCDINAETKRMKHGKIAQRHFFASSQALRTFDTTK